MSSDLAILGWTRHAGQKLHQRYGFIMTCEHAREIMVQIMAAAWPLAPMGIRPAEFLNGEDMQGAVWRVRLMEQDVRVVVHLRPTPLIVTFLPRSEFYEG